MLSILVIFQHRDSGVNIPSMNVTSALGWILGSQTPNGAIDVIAIRHPDGTVNCSPFHVKLPISRSPNSRNIVKLTVNGKEVKLSMKLGSAGEAFFVERTKNTNGNTEGIKVSPPVALSPISPSVIQCVIPDTGSPSVIRRVQSEGDLKNPRVLVDMVPSLEELTHSPIASNSKSEHAHESFDRSSKRRAFTFAGDDDFDVLTSGKEDETSSVPLTEKNLILAANEVSSASLQSENTSPRILRSASRSEWTWAWGTLPIKASDPSIADLQSLTDLALREKLASSSQAAGQSSQIKNLNPLAEGKNFVASPMSQTLLSEPEERESRPVPPDTKNNANSLISHEVDQNSQSDSDLPEPKCPQIHHPHPARIRSHTLSDDYRHTSASPSLREDKLANETSKQTDSLTSASHVPPHISARAATIAAALGSDRILSLCAHVLSSELSPRSEDELIATLREHAVSPEEFSSNPLEILNNPNLVVVVNNLLIPWRLVHAHLTVTPSTPRDGSTQENLTIPASEKTNLWWAGRTVTNWGVGYVHEDTKPKTGECPGNLSIPSASRSGSLQSLPNTDGKVESRRNSYGNNNHEEEDFDQYECMSEGSSTGPTWSHALSGNPTLEDMDTPGAHLWNKETLNWNSADDFQRLLNEYTTADAVPDLLKPYVAYSNLWPTEDNEEVILSTGQKESSKTAIPESFSTIITTQTLSVSRSHDSALSNLRDAKKSSQPSEVNQSNKADSLGTPLGSPILNSLPDGKTNHSSNATNFDDEALKEGGDGDIVEYLSLEDISPDEILPGPAREVYDGSDTDSFYSLSLEDDNHSHASSAELNKNSQTNSTSERKYRYRKTLVPSQEQIKSMNLVDGLNEITFEAEGNKVTAHIFVWPEDAKIVVADIEGALFVSGSSGGALGLMMSLWGTSASARRETHEGLAQLFDSISSNGYRFLYITTKPDSSQKEQLLKSSARGSTRCLGLPPGPVFLPPNALIQTIGSERTDLFKAAALRGVKSLFPPQHNPYHAAFGANARDVRTFDRCEIPPGRTFLVNEKGEATTMTTVSTKRSFTEMNSLLHQLFPSFCDTFARAKAPFTFSAPAIEDTYSDFNYWRLPPPVAPPLPPLSKKK